MSRDVKFRGISENTDKWVYGQFTRIKAGGCILPAIATERESDFGDYVDYISIKGESLGQYSGFNDIKGKNIYEGDILMLNTNGFNLMQVCFGEFGVIEFETEEVIERVSGWHLKSIPTDSLSKAEPFCNDSVLNNTWIRSFEMQVVGNIYENKELLEEQE